MWRRSGGVGLPYGRHAGLVSYEGDLPSPVTTYASAAPYTPMVSVNVTPPSTAFTRSAVVHRIPRRRGIRYFYGHGSTPMPSPGVRASNRVESSMFQPIQTKLVNWTQNDAWFEGGYPRNLGYSFRTPQLQTQTTGGPGPGMMAARPLFPRVQKVRRYSTYAPTYNTRSAST